MMQVPDELDLALETTSGARARITTLAQDLQRDRRAGDDALRLEDDSLTAAMELAEDPVAARSGWQRGNRDRLAAGTPGLGRPEIGEERLELTARGTFRFRRTHLLDVHRQSSSYAARSSWACALRRARQ